MPIQEKQKKPKKNKIYKLEKGEDRIPILKLARSRSKTSISRTSFLVQQCLGCDRVNRNGARKLIDCQRGETCLLATNELCWRQTKAKYLNKKTYLTRQRQRYLKC